MTRLLVYLFAFALTLSFASAQERPQRSREHEPACENCEAVGWMLRNYERILDATLPVPSRSDIGGRDLWLWTASARIVPTRDEPELTFMLTAYRSGRVTVNVKMADTQSLAAQSLALKVTAPTVEVDELLPRLKIRGCSSDDEATPVLRKMVNQLERLEIPLIPSSTVFMPNAINLLRITSPGGRVANVVNLTWRGPGGTFAADFSKLDGWMEATRSELVRICGSSGGKTAEGVQRE